MTAEAIDQAHALGQTHPSWPAATRLAVARAKATATAKQYDWEPSATGLPQCEFDQDGWNIQVSLMVDHDTDLSWEGEFTDHWQDGVVPTGGRKYFLPAITRREHYTGLRALGYTRNNAWLTAGEYVQDALDHVRGDEYEMVGVVVTAHRAGVELGEASLWGVELSNDSWPDPDHYVIDVMEDLTAEAINEAKAALAALQGQS